MIGRLDFVPSLGISGITVLQMLALIPPVIIDIIEKGAGQAGILTAALVTAVFWDLVFASIRKRPFRFHGITVALVVTVFVPPSLPLWQLVLVLSLAVVLSEHIFGGRGFGFLSPAAVALSLLVFSFPQVHLELTSMFVAVASLPGALLLLFAGLISWRVIIGTLSTLAVLFFLLGNEVHILSLGIALMFGITFLICDPTSASSTNPGRWAFGFLAGALIFIFSGNTDHVTSQGIVFASITASIFAPLIDHLVVLVHARRRSRQRV